jgi:pyruvate,water dikinase
MNETYTNVEGEEELCDRILDCWASMYAERVVAYRARTAGEADPAIAVVVQRMVDAERSGVTFSVEPHGDRKRLMIEAAFGLGEAVVSGEVQPDNYTVARPRESDDAPELLTANVGEKSHKLVRDPKGGNRRVELEGRERTRRVLDDRQVLRLAQLALRIERHYGRPQDIEWAMESDEIFLLQSRPITTLGDADDDEAALEDAEVLVEGLGASKGVAAGRVKLLQGPDEGGEFDDGDVLVTAMTAPDWVPIMARAAAFVTDSGGMTSHAAIVGRELGVPCVVGAGTATERLADGQTVTVDGAAGKVYEGDVTAAIERSRAGGRGIEVGEPHVPEIGEVTPLGTRLYVNLAVARRAEEVAALPVDGVGLLRAEFLVTDALQGEHPKAVLAAGRRTSSRSPARSTPVRWSTAPSTSRPTSSAASAAAPSTSRRRRTRCSATAGATATSRTPRSSRSSSRSSRASARRPTTCTS